MKKQLLILLITVLSFNCFSQISFEKGYYINNSNKKINCLIKNIDWKNNPTEFEYKKSETSESKYKTIKTVKEFGIENILKFVRRIVNIDRSSEWIPNLSNNKHPIFLEEELFLKILVDGKATLYQYVDNDLKRYFYNQENSNIKQLIFKSYKTTDDKVGKNNGFRQQLWVDLKCPSIKMNKIESLEYYRNDLVKFFVEYNKCNNQEYVNFEEKQKRDLFNLTIRPRLNNSSLKIKNSDFNSMNIDFENKNNFGVGIEAELILPFNKNKWAIVIEPTYQNFKSEKIRNSNDVSGGILIAKVDYSSIEIPTSLRHYFFLKNDSKIFINASYIIDLEFKKSIEFTRNNESTLNSLKIETTGNLALGIGYKYNNYYSLEIRYQTNREILENYTFWKSGYKTLSIIFGYSIF